MVATSYSSHSHQEHDPLLIVNIADDDGSINHQPLAPPQISRAALLGCLVLLLMGYLVMLRHDIRGELKRSTVNQHILRAPQATTATTRRSSSSSNGHPTPPPVTFHNTTTILIVHVSDDEAQKRMAFEVAKGAQSIENTVVIVKDVATASFELVTKADGVILGSSVENGSTHPSLQHWMNDAWSLEEDFTQKVGGSFVTAGWISAGQESTLLSLSRSMMIFGMIIVGGDSWTAPFGAAAVTSEAPYTELSNGRHDHLEFNEACYQHQDEIIHPMFLSKAHGLGVRVATVAHQLREC